MVDYSKPVARSYEELEALAAREGGELECLAFTDDECAYMVVRRNWIGSFHSDDEDKPAVVWDSGRMEWWVNDKLHRGYGLPAVIDADGFFEWWRNGVKMSSCD